MKVVKGSFFSYAADSLKDFFAFTRYQLPPYVGHVSFLWTPHDGVHAAVVERDA